MPHPLVVIHSSDWMKILDHLKETIAFLALSDGKNPQETEVLMQAYVTLIDSYVSDIFLANATDIMKYLNFYNVRPTEGVHDEFKGIYFTGMVLSRFLKRDGLVDLNKLHMRAVLRLLDYRLVHPHKANRTNLSDRIKKAIENDTIADHFGDYGWYLVYKCLYNSVNEMSRTL